MSRRLRYLSLGLCCVVISLGIVGCASMRTPPPEWTPEDSRRAQVHWLTREASTTFDAVFARSPQGDAAIDLYKGGPRALVRVRLGADGRAWLWGDGLRGSWHGPREAAPLALEPWLVLAAAYAGEKALPEGQREIHSPSTRTALNVRNRRLAAATVAGTESGTVINAVFR